MATNKEDTKATDNEQETTVKTTEIDPGVKQTTPETTTGNVAEDKLQELFDKFNTKVDELTTSYDKKIADLQAKLDEKTTEVNKLKNVNAQILMNTSVVDPNKEIDYSTVDFSDVNWDEIAAEYIKSRDDKIF